MNGLTVRKAGKKDIPEIMRIIREAFLIYMENGCLPSPPSALFETADEIYRDICKKCVLVAEYKGCVAGTLRLEFGGNRAYLSRFAVDPAFQRAGIGGKLLAAADEECVSCGCTAITLHTSMSAKSIVRLYKSHGYSVVEINGDRGYKRGKLEKILNR